MKREFETIRDDQEQPASAENSGDVMEISQQEMPKQLTFEEVVSPEHLKMISESSGGFRFRPDASLQPGRTGYTDLRSRTIYYNPMMLAGNPELGIKPWTKTDIKGFTYHEAGHHAPQVVSLQDKLIADLKQIEIPEAYKGSASAEERFVKAIWSNLDNTLADVWLESFMGRRPYYPVGKAITEFQKGKGEPESYKGISMPEQLLQVLLRSRYFREEKKGETRDERIKSFLNYGKGLKDKMNEEVSDSYKAIIESGAMEAILNNGPFANFFASPAEMERCIALKMQAYKQVFLPEYLKLLEKELEERKKQKQQQKQQGQQGQQNQQGQDGEEQEGQPQSGPSEGTPLTKEEEEELKQEILEELEKLGQEKESQAPSEEEKNQINQTIQKIRKALEKEQAKREGKTAEVEPEGNEGQEEGEVDHSKEKKGEEAIKELAKELERRRKEAARKGTGEALGVSPEVVKKWEGIKERYKNEISSLATSLAEVFLDDRRKKMEYLRREGYTVPGLEYEEISAQISGETDPQTRMTVTRNPEFLETELEFIVDTSGSMSGNKIEKSVDLLVVGTEALKKVRELLSAENLLNPEEEQPFKLGVTKFTTEPERITKLAEPIGDKKEVQIIDKVLQIGGGTEETGAISQVYEELRLGKKNVIKIICVLTDGQGNQAGVAPIIQQIEKDKEVMFLVVGLGDSKDDANAIVQTYVEPLGEKEGNVHGFAAESPEQALPAVLEFLKREVNKRKQSI